MVAVKRLLQQLDLGNSVAEFDQELEEYFVETEAFRLLVGDKIDIVAGDKGTGKTAIFRILQTRYPKLIGLESVQVLTAFNPQGAPIFEKLGQLGKKDEGDYIALWKGYVLSLAGNWLLKDRATLTTSMKQLDLLLRGLELRSSETEASGIFSRALHKMSHLFQWKSAEIEYSLSPDGKQTVRPKVEFGDVNLEPSTKQVSIDAALRLLNNALGDADVTIWVALDRLDEAFQAYPEMEVSALRALFRAYLDLLEFPNIRLKLFVRRDLFRRVTTGGFVNLTHVNARKWEVIWDEEDLLNLLCRRIRKNDIFCNEADLKGKNDKGIFERVFPEQVDFGSRKPKTWVWMMRRIRDGNDIKPPRNLIDLISMAKQAQLRTEDRNARELSDGAIIEADALRRGLRQLSQTRVNDTLLAETRSLSPTIERFRDGKAEHNEASLAKLLEVHSGNVRNALRPLLEAGFLEDVGTTYKVPTLYREGLGITQGKAFDEDVSTVEDDDA